MHLLSLVGASPRTPRGRSAGTPKAPLRGRGARTCAPWPVVQLEPGRNEYKILVSGRIAD
jgi:hypothetical protein